MNTHTDYGATIALPCVDVNVDTRARMFADPIDRCVRVSVYESGRLARVAKRLLNGWEGPQP